MHREKNGDKYEELEVKEREKERRNRFKWANHIHFHEYSINGEPYKWVNFVCANMRYGGCNSFHPVHCIFIPCSTLMHCIFGHCACAVREISFIFSSQALLYLLLLLLPLNVCSTCKANVNLKCTKRCINPTAHIMQYHVTQAFQGTTMQEENG